MNTGAELLFELVSQRYERGSTMIISILPFDEWTKQPEQAPEWWQSEGSYFHFILLA